MHKYSCETTASAIRLMHNARIQIRNHNVMLFISGTIIELRINIGLCSNSIYDPGGAGTKIASNR